ncbi:MAG: FkbM family methyltransferase [Flavobacteriales bacterium]
MQTESKRIHQALSLKTLIRKILIRNRIALTRNLRYDIQTERIIRQSLGPHHVAIDVGAHKGEILDIMLSCSPQQQHYAFEPIPWLHDNLLKNYPNVHVLPYALSHASGQSTFHIVKNDLAYSGIKRRSYRQPSPDVETVHVEMRTLDELLPDELAIRLIKIDVEGGEYDVMQGAVRTITHHHPILIFEFGKGASEHYNCGPEKMFDFMQSLNYAIFTLDAFLNHQSCLQRETWMEHYAKGTEYYFVAQFSAE